MNGYASPHAVTVFRLLIVATFLCFVTMTSLSVLSVFLIEAGIDASTTGFILGSAGPPIIVATLFSGVISARFGTGATAAAGMVVMLVGFASFEATITSPAGAAASRIVQAVGMGLFMPAAMTYAKNLLSLERMVFLFGMYSTMFPLPNMVGPLFAETYYDLFGLRGLFLVLSLPALAGLALMLLCLRLDSGRRGRPLAVEGYLRLLRRPALRAPSLLVLAIGVIWGFSTSFMAVLLRERAIPVEYFFVTFTVMLVVGRFVLLRFTERHAPIIVLTAAALLLGGGYLMLAAFGTTPAGVIAGATVFALGHCITYPTLSVWATSAFAPAERVRPVALFNALFYAGIFAMPLFGGVAIAAWSVEALLYAMGLFALLLAAGLGAGRFVAAARAVSASRG